MHRIINYSLDGYQKTVSVELSITDSVQIPEQAINKALMIAMNYLIENMETEAQEEPE
jgi:hypothetical protein